MLPRRPTERLGDYELVRELGEGGFGTVYEARKLRIDKPVALKVLHPHMVKDADVIIRPECGITRFDDISRRREMILAGENAAREAMPKIRELLKQ